MHRHAYREEDERARATRCIICLLLRQESARPSALLPALSALSRNTFAPLFHFARIGRLFPSLSLSFSSLRRFPSLVRVSFPFSIRLASSHSCIPLYVRTSLSLFVIYTVRARRLRSNLADELRNMPFVQSFCRKIADVPENARIIHLFTVSRY